MKYVRKGNPDFKGDDHQDCHEFSIWFLNEMNDILNRKFISNKVGGEAALRSNPSCLIRVEVKPDTSAEERTFMDRRDLWWSPHNVDNMLELQEDH